VLTADSSESFGIKWSVAAAGAKGGGTDKIFWENGQTVGFDYTISSGANAGSFGPIAIGASVTVTVPSGATWTVV
jgi:type II secretory pathway component GspD/PulD (secretin)